MKEARLGGAKRKGRMEKERENGKEGAKRKERREEKNLRGGSERRKKEETERRGGQMKEGTEERGGEEERLNPTKYLVRSFFGGRNSYQGTTWLVPLIES